MLSSNEELSFQMGLQKTSAYPNIFQNPLGCVYEQLNTPVQDHLQENLPGVYSSVPAQRGWIDQEIKRNGGGNFCAAGGKNM